MSRICDAFCVLNRPYMVWSDDVDRDLSTFLEKMDTNFHNRMAHSVIRGLFNDMENLESLPRNSTPDTKSTSKDYASLVRIFWHHGIETLLLILGSLVQAPHSVHAYFLKCRNEDLSEIADLLLFEKTFNYSRLADTKVTISKIMRAISTQSGWNDGNLTADRFEKSFRDMLRRYLTPEHRQEFNSLKHGMRAYHGEFTLTVGVEDEPGKMAPPENMQCVGHSKDTSFFGVSEPLLNASKSQSKIHFSVADVSVSWSMEKVLCDLQLISLMIGNIVSYLKILNGAQPGSVNFTRPADAEVWWNNYDKQSSPGVTTSKFCAIFNASEIDLPTYQNIVDAYKAT